MAEILKMVRHGAGQVTLKILAGVHSKLPMLKVEFAQINAPKYPHLVDQLEFLADVVEDYLESADRDLPMVAVAEAVYALVYAHRQFDLIPDSGWSGDGHADDSSVVRVVLMAHEKAFAAYAARRGLEWEKVSVKP